MGKANIISHLGDGKYSVNLQFNSDHKNEQLTSIDTNINSLQDQLADLTPGTLSYNIVSLQITALNKQKASLEAIPDEESIQAWCADLTEDLSGVVGTMEIPGEREAINIQPGHGGNGAYNRDRDGLLTKIMAQTPEQAYFNVSQLPGWQKWKPTFRYAEITSIDGDVADVTIDTTTSTQQGLNINQSETLSAVPIEYMDCNGQAFAEGDAVLVKFEGQIWTSPVIVGFKDNPKPCGYDFFIKPVFNGHEPIQGNQTIKISLTVEGTLIESEGVVYGVRNESTDPILDGLVDFRGAGVPAKISDPAIETSVYVKSAGRMDLIGLETDPEFIANLGYMEDFTFLHYSVSDSSDYTIKYKGVYLKEVEYKVGDYPIAEGTQSTVTVEGVEYDVYEMDFSNLSALKQTPNAAALDNENAWVKSMQHTDNGPGIYGPWLDNRYSNIYYYPNAWQKAYDYEIDPRPEFWDRVLDDWLYNYCVLERGWWAQLRELNLTVDDSLGGGGDIGNIPVTSFVIISDPDGNNPAFENYNVTRSAGTYRLYYLQDCVNEGQPAYPAVEGEDYSPYTYVWGYSMVDTPPELW